MIVDFVAKKQMTLCTAQDGSCRYYQNLISEPICVRSSLLDSMTSSTIASQSLRSSSVILSDTYYQLSNYVPDVTLTCLSYTRFVNNVKEGCICHIHSVAFELQKRFRNCKSSSFIVFMKVLASSYLIDEKRCLPVHRFSRFLVIRCLPNII